MDTILAASLDLLAWLSDYRQFTHRWDLSANPDGCGEQYAERAALMERRGVILAAIAVAEARAVADPNLGMDP